ncbi:MAG TPA: cupredoxin domain-containing protein [Caldilineaceae bacterium]|nr:cupredoxin domain-containing protein [Caldilineaceae bacterium]
MYMMSNRWPQLLGVLLLSVAIGACGGNRPHTEAVADSRPAQPSHQESSSEAGATIVTVVTSEFDFTLDPTPISAGTVTFVIQNNGHAPHDFAIEGKGVNQKSAMIQPGARATLTIDLTPGSYTYLCDIPGHAMLGMKGSFTVN